MGVDETVQKTQQTKWEYVDEMGVNHSFLPPENDGPLPKDAILMEKHTYIAEHYPVNFSKISVYMDTFFLHFMLQHASWHSTVTYCASFGI